MDLSGAYSKNRLRPGMPPVRVCNHLRFVNNRNVIVFIKIRHLNGRSHDSAVRFLNALLPGPHGAGNLILVHLLVHLQRQQAKRSQIDAAPGQFQPLQGPEGLAAVGRADVQNEAPVHLTHLRKFQLRTRRHQFQNAVLDFVLPIPGIQSKQRFLTDFSRHGAPKIRQKFSVHSLLLLFQKHPQIQKHQFGEQFLIDQVQNLFLIFPDGVTGHMPNLPMQLLQVPDVDPGGLRTPERPAQSLRLFVHSGIFRRLSRLFPAFLCILLDIKLQQFLFIDHALLPLSHRPACSFHISSSAGRPLHGTVSVSTFIFSAGEIISFINNRLFLLPALRPAIHSIPEENVSGNAFKGIPAAGCFWKVFHIKEKRDFRLGRMPIRK